jgi:hypothetical protein
MGRIVALRSVMMVNRITEMAVTLYATRRNALTMSITPIVISTTANATAIYKAIGIIQVAEYVERYFSTNTDVPIGSTDFIKPENRNTPPMIRRNR